MLGGQPIGPRRQRALQVYGRVVGAGYLVLGIIGLLLAGFTPFAPADGDTLLIFSINPFTTLIHLAVGLVVIPAAESERTLRPLALLAGVLMTVWAVLGYALDGSTADIFATNFETATLHLVTGLVGLGLAVGLPRRTPAAGTA
jgi:hypothetical protein